MFSPLQFLPASELAPSALMMGDYDPYFVALSVAMAVLAAIGALQIAGVTQNSAGRLPRAGAIAAATFMLGAGIWSMHFIGMLAFRLCTEVSYRAGPTLVSMLPGLAAAFVAVLLMTRRNPSRYQRTASGVLIGAGIAAMHYSGMGAMALAPQLRYDPTWFCLSLLVGVSLSVLALQVHGGLLRLRWLSLGRASIAGGVVLGLAIACTHYVGMRAALFVGQQDLVYLDARAPTTLALAVALVSLLLIGVFGSVWGLLHYRTLVQRLQTNENRLQSVINGTVEGIAVLDAQGRIYRFNRSAERITGHDAAQMLGHNLLSLLLAPDDTLTAYLQGTPLPDGTAPIAGIVREVVLRQPNGQGLEARLSIGRVEVPGEKLFVAFISDIGEQKRTERALRDRETEYGTLIRNIPGTFFRLDMDPTKPVPFVSEQVHSIVGWPAADFISGRRSLRDLVHPDDLARVDAAAERAAAGSGRHDLSFECRLQHADGSHRWISANCEVAVTADGGPRYIDGVMVDITEAKLRAAEFEGTVRAIGHALAVIEFDVEGRILGANENFLNVTGYTLDEVRGQSHAMFCDPAYVDSPGYADFWNTLRRGEFHIGEYERFGRGGKPLWLQASYNPVLGADGRLLKIVKFASDITDRRAVQEALREAKERAEQAVASRTAFMANMSHEIRTPMNAVIGFTELLLDTPLSPLQRQHLETVRQSSGSLLGLLNGILDSAKLEKGAMELELQAFSLRQLATQVTDSLRIGATPRNVALVLDYEDGLSEHFRGDAMRLRQVLVNLVSNSVKFTEHGSVRVTVRRRAGAQDFGGPVVPLHIAVQDTGIGIAADRLEAIFQPFSQADASMSRRFGGTGLGITIARQLVELMGGAIAVESQPGVGSVFHVYLPLPAVAPPQPQPAPALPEEQEQALSVLAVDDVRQNAELLQMALGAVGHDVAIATDGAEAVAAWVACHFDLVLMDVHMPGMDGREAVRRIREMEAASGRPRTAVIALTASVLEEDRRAAREAGMDGFVAKPIDLEALRREMARVAQAVDVLNRRRPADPDRPAPGSSGAPGVRAEIQARTTELAIPLTTTRAALDALLRGQVDDPALETLDRVLREQGDADLADLLADGIGQFDFERAASLLAPLMPPTERIAA